MSFLELASVKDQLKIQPNSSISDTALQALMDAVTFIVERHTGVIIEQRSFSDELHLAQRTSKFRVLSKPLVSVTSITDAVSGAVDLTGMFTRKSGLIVLPYSLAPDIYLTVEYTAGLDATAIPENYKQAGMIIAQQMWETRRGGMPSTAAALDESMSRESYRQGFLVGFVIPNRALELLGTRPPVVA